MCLLNLLRLIQVLKLLIHLRTRATCQFIKYEKEFTPARMTHFQRDITYSYFALPSFFGNPNNRSVDTLITMTTSLGMPANTQDCYIKLFNAFPDSLSSFAMTIGCPSATQIFSNVFYRQITQPMLINTGNVPISISRRTPHGETILGTYSINLISKGQYDCNSYPRRKQQSQDNAFG